MQRQVTKVILDHESGQTRYRVVLTSDPCIQNSPEYYRYQQDMIQQVAANPGLIACGYNTFDRIVISYSTGHWILEASATVYEDEKQRP